VRVLRENYEYIGPLSGVVLIDKGKINAVLLLLTKLTALSFKKKKKRLTALVG